MASVRKRHTAEFKAKVAVEAIRQQKTSTELTAEYGIHATQISTWKRQAMAGIPEAFSSQGVKKQASQQSEIDELHRQIGQLVAERDWLKKKFIGHPLAVRKALIDPQDSEFSLRQQCGLLSVNRSGLYYQPVGESEENLGLMRLLDEQYTRTPYYGVLRMVAYLRHLGHDVNPKRIRRLRQLMGLETVYQKPATSTPNPEHQVYPYLLRGRVINRCNQVWSTDITYIRLASGFVYLMAVIDWYSRYVLGWALSTTLDADFCIEAVGNLLEQQQCEIFNTDQGAQFTTSRFTRPLLDKGIQVSMDGRGRALDNIFVERLWRTVKYEYVYLQDIPTVQEAWRGLRDFFNFYNQERFHQSLDYRTPAQVYRGEQPDNRKEKTRFHQPASILIS
ncbi:MAG: IS3 family transposase [Gammaproteobacteria bacterium]|nr:IS3 family transposase [Gammaproteobacteria bacterium]